MGGESLIMDKLKALLKNNPNIGLDEDTIAVANSNFANQTKRISLRGGVFRKIVGGKEVSAAEAYIMNVIIVKMAHTSSRAYYEDSYEEGKKVSPVCWSNDSVKPDPEVSKPQSESCHTCPNSVRGSGSGGVGTSCKLSWRVAIVLANDPKGDVLQLVLPANSCFGKEEESKWPFKAYVQMLADNKVSAGRVVTKMQFDANSNKPRVLFSPVEAVNEDTLVAVKTQAESQAAQSAIHLSVYQSDDAPAPEPVKFGVFTEEEGTTLKSTEANEDISKIVNKWRK